jgi:sortase A
VGPTCTTSLEEIAGMQPSFVTPPVPARGRSAGALLGDALRRPGGRRAVSVLSVVLFLAGVGMFAYPVGTDLYSRYHQDQLQERFDDPEVVTAYAERRIEVGDGLTTLRIPKLDVEILVVEGTTPAALRAGAGHYPDTPLPGEAGNVAIAGHRTTYGRPLNRMDELTEGDVVELETPFAVHTYRAVGAFDGHPNPWIVPPTDFSVVSQDVQGRMLTFTTCHPKGSARQRLIMRFELVDTQQRTPGGARS